MKFNIKKEALSIINTLEKGGFEAYLVGGCVRDMLLGREVFDFDITTSARPDEIKALFSKTVDTGIKHGTVTVIENGLLAEVTTYRTETTYKDSRHPDSVEYTASLAEDLARRDFTVNAIAYNPKVDIIDLFGGIKDLKSKVLRAVGKPSLRFFEDALRILRLFRFSATLGFKIEAETFDAAIDSKENLRLLSAERIYSELSRLCCGNFTENAEPLFKSGALNFLKMGELKGADKIGKLRLSPYLRFYALISNSSADTEYTLECLKVPNKLRDYFKKCDFIIKNPPTDRVSIKRTLNFCDNADIIFDCLDYLLVIKGKNTENELLLLKDILSKNEPYKISQLDISGEDLKALGYKDKEIGQRLEYLLDIVIADSSKNKKEILKQK